MRAWFARHPFREMVSPSPAYRLLVERELALFGAWYEIFPRSEGAYLDPETGQWRSGTLRTAAERLRAIAAMGFDVVYLTPVHPIGRPPARARTTRSTRPERPRQPVCDRLADGGHDSIHPDLGTFDDFDLFVRAARARARGRHRHRPPGLAGPPLRRDPPGVVHHPGRRHDRVCGEPTQEVPGHLPAELRQRPGRAYAEMRRVIQVWIDHGVTLFRVDNPHTKPVQFWQWLIARRRQGPPGDHLAVRSVHEARDDAQPGQGGVPAVVHLLRLAQHAVGAGGVPAASCPAGAAAYMRPAFWPTTHDILTPYMQYGGPTAWTLRAALAATLVPTYGIYAGYELMENVARQGAEEQVDNEKYEYKDRHWEDYEPGGAKGGRA